MSELRSSLRAYLALRRALGFKLERVGRLLEDFVTFAERAGAEVVTVDVALAWATLPGRTHPVWPAQRLGAVRGFARYLHALDARTEVPSADLLCGRYQRVAPYLYSEADVAALMAAARSLRPPLWAATVETFIGLLGAAGLRAGEAMRLDRDDLDPAAGLLSVRHSKFAKSRELPLHPSTVDALADYAKRRERCWPGEPSFFVSRTGSRLGHGHVQPVFRALCRRAGLVPAGAGPRPRLHSLRHTFAVDTLIGWYRDGGDIAARLPVLSTYLGHGDVAKTYWYLSAVPELLALSVPRLEARWEEGS